MSVPKSQQKILCNEVDELAPVRGERTRRFHSLRIKIFRRADKGLSPKPREVLPGLRSLAPMANGTSRVMGAANEVVSSGTCAGGPVCLPDCLPIYLPTYLSTHLVKINNYDETYEAAERSGDDPLDYVETGIRAGDTSELY
ncbi:hypothetical protein ALC53_08905 [Atta colombica]|uniref:Uncharacterized protein n=1 Tax=Atta colombica TaxID=520822 RepID=A0A195B8A2_9HYME|nr:hypothetical protein ALC53_08905 [Atta colombica]